MFVQSDVAVRTGAAATGDLTGAAATGGGGGVEPSTATDAGLIPMLLTARTVNE